MYVIHGQSGNLSTVVGTSSARKAVMHLNRMTRAGLHAFITDGQGHTFNPRLLLQALEDRRVRPLP